MADRYEEHYNHPEYVRCTMISTALAAEKEKEPIVLFPEFSDFADVFKNPKFPFLPTDPSTTPLNSMIPLFHIK